jgi:hypothetical protein
MQLPHAKKRLWGWPEFREALAKGRKTSAILFGTLVTCLLIVALTYDEFTTYELEFEAEAAPNRPAAAIGMGLGSIFGEAETAHTFATVLVRNLSARAEGAPVAAALRRAFAAADDAQLIASMSKTLLLEAIDPSDVVVPNAGRTLPLVLAPDGTVRMQVTLPLRHAPDALGESFGVALDSALRHCWRVYSERASATRDRVDGDATQNAARTEAAFRAGEDTLRRDAAATEALYARLFGALEESGSETVLGAAWFDLTRRASPFDISLDPAVLDPRIFFGDSRKLLSAAKRPAARALFAQAATAKFLTISRNILPARAVIIDWQYARSLSLLAQSAPPVFGLREQASTFLRAIRYRRASRPGFGLLLGTAASATLALLVGANLSGARPLRAPGLAVAAGIAVGLAGNSLLQPHISKSIRVYLPAETHASLLRLVDELSKPANSRWLADRVAGRTTGASPLPREPAAVLPEIKLPPPFKLSMPSLGMLRAELPPQAGAEAPKRLVEALRDYAKEFRARAWTAFELERQRLDDQLERAVHDLAEDNALERFTLSLFDLSVAAVTFEVAAQELAASMPTRKVLDPWQSLANLSIRFGDADPPQTGSLLDDMARAPAIAADAALRLSGAILEGDAPARLVETAFRAQRDYAAARATLLDEHSETIRRIREAQLLAKQFALQAPASQLSISGFPALAARAAVIEPARAYPPGTSALGAAILGGFFGALSLQVSRRLRRRERAT